MARRRARVGRPYARGPNGAGARARVGPGPVSALRSRVNHAYVHQGPRPSRRRGHRRGRSRAAPHALRERREVPDAPLFAHRPRSAGHRLPVDGAGHRRARRGPARRGLGGRRPGGGDPDTPGDAADRAHSHLGVRGRRGIHGAALSDGERLLLVAEDVGRHNAIDKIKGAALLRGIPTENRILLSTGRVSSEMLLKAARMGVPMVASRTSPTEMAVGLAEQLNITVCGYVRGEGLNLYAGSGLVLDAEVAAARG
ncbi:MAG: hypothetical protein DME03_19750 [Candidatus Rokuibacteriota bacterium]|nr:MAG: hypothetical protein DME03_19750 [Candidatus Rokubacteria bacterium]